MKKEKNKCGKTKKYRNQAFNLKIFIQLTVGYLELSFNIYNSLSTTTERNCEANEILL